MTIPVKSHGTAFMALCYVGFIVLMTALIVAIVWIAATQFGFDFGNSAFILLIPMFAAMQCGGVYVRRAGRRPPAGTIWVNALVFAVIAVAAFGGLIWANLTYTDLGAQAGIDLSSTGDRDIALIVLAVAAALMLVLNALGFWTGARGEAKRQEKLAQRAIPR